MSSVLPLYQHASIMKKECAQYLRIPSVSRHIDATLGLGGHAEYFFHCNPSIHIIGIDQDPYAISIAQKRLEPFGDRFQLYAQNFEHIANCKDFAPQSILFDLGVSSLQFDMPERGFSFRFDAPLDMRMDPSSEITAEIIVNEYDMAKLETIFREYGEEPYSKKVAQAIIVARTKSRITTTTQLAECIAQAKPKFWNRSTNAGGHPAVLCFQALRIAVNREMEVLSTALQNAIDILEMGGRIAVISFHSLEDRIVKQVFASFARKEKKQKYIPEGSEKKESEHGFFLESLCKKPLMATEDEVAQNPRARSARLRVVEKVIA